MIKNYNYMVTITLYPFILLLTFLKLTNVVKGMVYTYLIIALLMIFIPSFIMSLYGASEEILNSNKKWRMVLLIFLSIFYLPVYFTKYVSKEEKYFGYFLFIITIPLTIITINACNKELLTYLNRAYKNYVVANDNYVYVSKNNLFTINVDSSFRCNSKDIGEYVISCDRLEDDSFIGVYSYEIFEGTEEEYKEKLEFHINQTINYIKEKKYSYTINNDNEIIQIEYNDNIILISQNNYIFDEEEYSLIVLKEMPKEYINYDEYQKMIDSITFLNYNDGVSS